MQTSFPSAGRLHPSRAHAAISAAGDCAVHSRGSSRVCGSAGGAASGAERSAGVMEDVAGAHAEAISAQAATNADRENDIGGSGRMEVERISIRPKWL
jgi:hypothetical protein